MLLLSQYNVLLLFQGMGYRVITVTVLTPVYIMYYYCFRVWAIMLLLSQYNVLLLFQGMGCRVITVTVQCIITVSGYGLSCYYCHSADPGCGKELSIRLERWHSCPDVRAGGGENFCVKLIEKRGSKYRRVT